MCLICLTVVFTSMRILYWQCDEKKAVDLSSDTTKLIEDIHELRYFDDLLKLLEGELERISNRNWPFVLGHSEPREEMNLIIWLWSQRPPWISRIMITILKGHCVRGKRTFFGKRMQMIYFYDFFFSSTCLSLRFIKEKPSFFGSVT